MGMFDRPGHYKCTVNRGAINMENLEDDLNKHWEGGWRLHTIIEEGGNTIMVYERRDGELPAA